MSYLIILKIECLGIIENIKYKLNQNEGVLFAKRVNENVTKRSK